MTEVLQLYKKVGETPLECIMRFREANPDHKEVKMTYLGRLDPMAEGLLLVLAGDTRDKKKYLDMDKTYEFEVLWVVSTDTYDVLGKIEKVDLSFDITQPKIEKIMEKIKKKKTQSYPPYSSKTVGGKQLWQLSREGRIAPTPNGVGVPTESVGKEIDVPTRQIKIFNIEHIHTRWADSREVLSEVMRKVSLVTGDFRQEEILKSWNKELGIMNGEKFLISKFEADVSTGTYIRGLAHEMGKMLGIPALAFNIKRTRVGEYNL